MSDDQSLVEQSLVDLAEAIERMEAASERRSVELIQALVSSLERLRIEAPVITIPAPAVNVMPSSPTPINITAPAQAPAAAPVVNLTGPTWRTLDVEIIRSEANGKMTRLRITRE